MNMNANAMIWPFDNQKITNTIFGYLDCQSLRIAEHVCLQWKMAIYDGHLWEKVYRRNMQLPDWKKLEQVLKLRNPGLFPFPSEFVINNYKEACCHMEDTIKGLERKWTKGIYTISNYKWNLHPQKKRTSEPIYFSMSASLMVRVSPTGRISTRNRWAPEEEQIAHLLPNKNIPIDNFDLHPIIKSVQFNGDTFAAVGLVGTRKILFLFNVKEHADPLLLRCSAWRGIENTAADSSYTFNPENCIRLKNDVLVLCGKKVAGFSTVVSLMNTRTKESMYQNLEVTSRVGQLSDFTLDDWRIILFFGRKENPRLQQVDRYILQIRDLASFMLLKSFVLPITRSRVCHFDYSNGLAVTGSNDSPIRIWNVVNGTCDGDFSHGGDSLFALKIIADRLIITCDHQGIIKLWNLKAATDLANRDNPSRLLLRTLDSLPSPYKFRRVKTLAMQADEFQVALILQHDTKRPQMYLMDFLASVLNDEELEKKTRQVGESRQL
ncbi:LOW QUALITY PROTEIN: uncharacterized protein LOC130691049 [Daphnia carinata]|uniref:LOW QUALITY PROTEIN: uncharacterized protein LOC130691049 n=1 Tax=Daphnia carinata TaxID=120202 RepID=UPI002869384D|nr:LOW QUALITY PROTEIN: uncharacterized protein LOC130691049 [Daphnia carinata]